jgi:FAD/FMN-containing dehydrogenase
MAVVNDSVADALIALLGACKVLSGRSDLEHYGRDWTRQSLPDPSAVVFPESIEDVQAIVRWARATGAKLVPSGGRTGLSGGAVATNGEVVVSMERMNRILDFNAVDRSLQVQAGVITQAAQDAAIAQGLYYPVDFASRGSSHIGGNIATNAGGIKVLRYGMTRDWVTGLKVVTGTGELLDLNRGLVKNATGYDLRHLFIGCEGTLGFVVEATLQLTAPPPEQQVMVLALADMSALMSVFASLRETLNLSAFEFFDDRALTHVLDHGARRPFDGAAACYVLAEFDTDQEGALEAFQTGVAAGWIQDGVISQSHAQSTELWRLREGITESLSRFTPYKNDISVRVSFVPAFLDEAQQLLAREYPSYEVVWFGHIGDGNLHISMLKPDALSQEAFSTECGRVTALLCELLSAYGGSISAEHGIGLLKKPYLAQARSEQEISLMRAMKRVFDPAGILNPGKLFD